MTGDTAANRLGAYLRARRGLISPRQAASRRARTRRVPGLRREEVAMLAGISADYYLRLERGRDAQPVGAGARRAGAGAAARRGRAGTTCTASPSRGRGGAGAAAASACRHGCISCSPRSAAAFVEGRAFDVLAANELATALSPRLRPGENRLRSLLLDPEERAFHKNWAESSAGFIAAFRESVGDDVDDPRLVELVGELSLASGRFREQWARHDVRMLEGGTTTVNHPVVGELTLHRDKLPVEGLLLVLYYADAGSESAARLALLASLAAPRAAR